ncbi:MAG: hypothetical protein LUC50_07170 [Ruminococcus sp.]|nr:hypothetical protein [Ruminococcus sp.]
MRLARRVARGIIENELHRRQRQVLVLYYQEQKTMKEIAKLPGVTPSCISHTHRAACEMVQNRLRAYHLY